MARYAAVRVAKSGPLVGGRLLRRSRGNADVSGEKPFHIISSVTSDTAVKQVTSEELTLEV